MLSLPEVGFFIQLESAEPVFQITCLNHFSIVDFELTAVDSSYQEYIQLNEINYPFDTFENLFNQVEARISLMKISELHLTFENKQKLSFVNGELSVGFDSREMLNQFAVEILIHCGFEGESMFQKLTQHTNCYLEISVEAQDSFDPIALAK